MTAPAPSLDGRAFVDVDADGNRTTFHYTETEDVVSATYAGGHIRRGFLVGVRDGNELDLRFAQLYFDGTTAGGHVATRIEMLDDGRIRLIEKCTFESRRENDDSVVVELPPWGAGPVSD